MIGLALFVVFAVGAFIIFCFAVRRRRFGLVRQLLHFAIIQCLVLQRNKKGGDRQVFVSGTFLFFVLRRRLLRRFQAYLFVRYRCTDVR